MRAVELVKMYGHTRALAGIHASLRAGEVTVIEGPNGSGKSTLLSILAQLAHPTAGRVLYGKRDGARVRATLRRHIGILAHASMLYPDLSGRENLELFASLYDVESPARRVDELAQRFEVGGFFERPTRTYSRGQLQRVALARAIIHRPKLLLLDEPSTGLDAHAVERLVVAIEEERAGGAICVLVTHDAAFAERIGDRRLRLERGKVVEPEADAERSVPS